MTKTYTICVHNVPAYAADYPYLVARYIDGGFWFWGAYDNMEAAREAEADVDGVIFYS